MSFVGFGDFQMKWFFVLLLVAPTGCEPMEMQRQALLSCASAEGVQANFYRLYGGGATGWQTLHVSVQEKSAEPVVVLTMSHGYDVALKWESDTTLVVSYPASARVIDSKPSVAKIEVQLKPVPDSSGSLAGGSLCVVSKE